ncbi:MAG: hypothetical protein ACLQKK_21735 [Rhodomicrobium sp.]
MERQEARFELWAGTGQERRLIPQKRALSEIGRTSGLGLEHHKGLDARHPEAKPESRGLLLRLSHAKSALAELGPAPEAPVTVATLRVEPLKSCMPCGRDVRAAHSSRSFPALGFLLFCAAFRLVSRAFGEAISTSANKRLRRSKFCLKASLKGGSSEYSIVLERIFPPLV